MLTIIVAMSENHVIGVNNTLPWHLPNDLRHFREITLNHSVIMGRKTYKSIGKPLPNRMNFVLTRSRNYTDIPGCIVSDNIHEFVQAFPNDDREAFVIGGAEIYAAFLPYANEMIITRVHTELSGDAFFPEFDTKDWGLQFVEKHYKDESHEFDYTFEFWKKVIK